MSLRLPRRGPDPLWWSQSLTGASDFLMISGGSTRFRTLTTICSPGRSPGRAPREGLLHLHPGPHKGVLTGTTLPNTKHHSALPAATGSTSSSISGSMGHPQHSSTPWTSSTSADRGSLPGRCRVSLCPLVRPPVPPQGGPG